MSTFPSAALVQRVQRLILETFEVSEKVAKNHAAGLVALAEGWGHPRTADRLDWEYRVKKRLSEAKYKWRSDADRENFEEEKKLKHESYESVIREYKRRRR
jgi:hypothetical protein